VPDRNELKVWYDSTPEFTSVPQASAEFAPAVPPAPAVPDRNELSTPEFTSVPPVPAIRDLEAQGDDGTLGSRHGFLERFKEFSGGKLFWNWVHDILFVSPNIEGLTKSLESAVLLAALLSSIVMSLPLSFDFEEIELVRERFNNTLDYGKVMDGNTLIRNYVCWVAWSVCLLANCILTGVMVLVGVHTTHGKNGHIDLAKSEVQGEFWRLARWPYLWAFLTLILGVVCSFYSFNRTVVMKFPDLLVEEHGHTSWYSQQSAYGYFSSITTTFLTLPTVASFVAISVGKRSVYRKLRAA
jgi:hypothetical protein